MRTDRPVEGEQLTAVLRHQVLLASEEVDKAILIAGQRGLPLLRYLIIEKIIDDVALAKACAVYFGVKYLPIHKLIYDETLLVHIPDFYLHRYSFIPLRRGVAGWLLSISDPDCFPLLKKFAFEMNESCECVFTPYKSFIALINRMVSNHFYHLAIAFKINAVDIVKQVLTDAIYQGASDVHFEPFSDSYRLRLRVDGLLRVAVILPDSQSEVISNHIKALADLDISEKRLPQDGRFHFKTTTDITSDIRVSICATVFGEKIVLRLLNSNQQLLHFNELGLEKSDEAVIIKKIKQPQGLILLTGPTGSGKTVLLYTILNYLNDSTVNVCSVEDPVEIRLSGINQVNVNAKIGLSFSVVLRAFLRQDPDIIMVGEIRDFETAQIAMRAAHTGHLVLSTLHTNSAVESINRLLEMGIEPFNIAGALCLVIAQRLIRCLCPYCHHTASRSECHFCVDGYRGRTGIYEVLPMTNSLRQLILKKASDALLDQAKREGFETLWEAGMKKVNQGITNLSELHRAVIYEI